MKLLTTMLFMLSSEVFAQGKTYNIKPPMLPAIPAPGDNTRYGFLKDSPPDMHQLNFRWRNQRQLRKQRRRAAAAGRKNVFKKRLRGTTR